jgi:DHA2 family multidrug resistance protein
VLALLGIAAFVPNAAGREKRGFDLFGFALLSIAIGALQLMLDRGNTLDWFDSTEVVLEAATAALALYLFLTHMFTADKPFIEPGLFTDRNFVAGILLMFTVGVLLLATMALLPPFLQSLLGFPVITAGYVLAPRGAGTMVSMMVVGRLVGKVDTRILVLTGLGLMGWSLHAMTQWNADVGVADIVYTGVVQGVGLGFIFVPLSAIAFATLAPRYRNEGTAMFSLIRNLGSSVGISLVMTVLGHEVQQSHAQISASITPFRDAFQAPGVPPLWNLSSALGRAALDSEVTRQALTIAYLNDFRFMMYLCLLAVPLLLLLRSPRINRG